MSKLQKLQNDLEKISKDITNAKVNEDYHNRKMREALRENDFKEYEVHQLKAKFASERLHDFQSQELVTEREIKDEEELIREGEFKGRVKGFDLAMHGMLKKLRDSLSFLVEKEELSNRELQKQFLELRNYYDRQGKYGSDREMQWREIARPYEVLNFSSVNIRLGHIIETYAEANRIGSPINAQKVANYKLWTRHVISQIDDCLRTIVGRSGLEESILKKIKDKLEG